MEPNFPAREHWAAPLIDDAQRFLIVRNAVRDTSGRDGNGDVNEARALMPERHFQDRRLLAVSNLPTTEIIFDHLNEQ